MIPSLTSLEEWNFIDHQEHSSDEQFEKGISMQTWTIGNSKLTRKNLEKYLKEYYKQ